MTTPADSHTDQSQRSGPLSGIRIVELGSIGPAPFGAMILADLGAEVLRIARPGVNYQTVGDGAATTDDSSTPQGAGDEDIPDASNDAGGIENPYDILNRSRSSVPVDLRADGAKEFVHSLLADADVLIEGFRPGVLERLVGTDEEILEVNPRIIIARMTGFGQNGRLAPRAGHDLNYASVAGAVAHIGRKDQPPTPPLNLVSDFGGGGMLMVVGVLAALLERSQSGHGQVVDAAMVDGTALLMAPFLGAVASGFWSMERGTNLLDSGAPFYDVYECSDGKWLSIGALESQFYSAMLAGLGLNEQELPPQMDESSWPALREAIGAAVKTRTRDEWVEHFGDTDSCVFPVLDLEEAPEYGHLQDRQTFIDIGGVAHPAPAPRFSRSELDAPTPVMEQQNPVAVLRSWGVDAGVVADLQSRGIIQSD